MFCANCGKPLGEGVLFCRFCGAKVEVDSTAPETPVHTEKQPPEQSPMPAQAEASAQPAAPEQIATSAQPEPPAQSAAPEASAQPVPPVQSAAPGAPAQPAPPVQSAAPETPAQPVPPVQNAAPETPAQPVPPVQNAAPETPVQPVNPNPPYQSQYQPAAEAPGKKKKFPWIPVLIATVVLGAAVFAAFYFHLFNLFRSNEALISDRVEAIEEALNEFDLDDILSCVSSENRKQMDAVLKVADKTMEQQSGMNMEDLMELSKMLNANNEMFQLEMDSVSVKGDKAEVHITMTVKFMGESQSDTVEIPMVKERNDWYVGGSENDLDRFFNQDDSGFDTSVLDG